jgi:hypothetical protein
MKLSASQTAQAVAAARDLIKAKSTGFIDYDSMVTDDEIANAITQVMAAVDEEPKS